MNATTAALEAPAVPGEGVEVRENVPVFGWVTIVPRPDLAAVTGARRILLRAYDRQQSEKAEKAA